VSVLLIGGRGYLGSALAEALPDAEVLDGEYENLTEVDLRDHAWVVFLAYRKREDARTDSARFERFLSRLSVACRLLLVSSAAIHGTGDHAEKMRRREELVAGRDLTCVVRPGSVCGSAPGVNRDSLLNRMVADARERRAVKAGNVSRPVLTIRDWTRAIVHILDVGIASRTYELASFNAWMPALGGRIACRFDAALDVVPELGASLDCRLDTRAFEQTGFAFVDGMDSAIADADRAVSSSATLTGCLSCGGTQLNRVLDFGDRPLANALLDRPLAQTARYPLALVECPCCGHWQLAQAVDASAMFPAGYPYRAGVTDTTRRHFADLAGACASRVAGRRALEIACNDGTMLRALAREGFTVCGVDPAPQAPDFDILRAFWSTDAAARLFPQRQFDLVCASNVLAHVPDPVDFLSAIAQILALDGVAVVEVTDTERMTGSARWDLIYHEHLSYFRESTLALVASRSGLRVDAIERVPAHGGSIRAWLSKRESSADRFAAAVWQQIETLRAMLIAAPRPIIGFGAPAKAALLIEEVGVRFDYLADDTPAKIGKYVPGSRCKIRPLSALAREPGPVTIVLLAWNFPDEFAAWMRANRPAGTDRVIYV
jgi:SAM-dependent methyltransferase